MFFIALAAAMPSIASAEDWPRWRGPRADGTWNGPALPETWPDEGLPVAWRQPIGGGFAGVVVSQGRAYTMDRQTAPAEVERVLCFDADSGLPLWTHEYPVVYADLDYGSGPRAAPTVHDGRIYTLGAVGHLHCLDAATGEPIWSKDFVADFGTILPEWGLAASPLVVGELVIAHPGARPGGCFIAFDRRTGREVWRAGSDPAGYCTPILDESTGTPQLVAWTPETMLGLSPSTGEIHWSFPYKVTYGVSIATPIVHRGIAFITGYWEGSKAIRLAPRPAEAELIWEDDRNLRGLMAQPLARDGYVYSLDKQFGLTCFEIATGDKLWDDGNQMTPEGRNPQATMVWLGDGDRAIALNSNGELVLARLSPQGYAEQSRTKIIGETWAHPAYAGTRIYARSDTELVCCELASGE